MHNVDTVSFGDLLRHYRLAAGLTQEELAERANLSARGISDLERGARSSPRKDTLLLLADALTLAEPERARFQAAAHAARYAATAAEDAGNVPDRGRPAPGGDIAAVHALARSRVDALRERKVPRPSRPAVAGLVALLVLATAATGLVIQRSARLNEAVSMNKGTGRTFAPWGPARPAPATSAPHLMNPLMVAVDHQGNMYVTEGSALYSGNALASHRAEILKLSQTGRVLARWGRYGTRPGEFNEPAGIAVDSHGNVYVADFGNNRIQKLSSSGRVLAVWGSYGSTRGEFDLPLGLTVDAQDNVYVADYLNSRIQELSPSGKVLEVWGGTCGAAPRQFCDPFDVAVSPTGDIYVADFGNNRILRLSPAGRQLSTWSMPGFSRLTAAPYGPNCPTGVAIDARGNVYVLRHGSTVVYKFSAWGKLLATWDVSPHSSSYATGLALDSHGRLIVVRGNQLYRVSPDGQSTAPLSTETQPIPVGFDQPSVLATGPHGTVYIVTGPSRDRVEQLSRSSQLLATWHPQTSSPGATFNLTGAVVDSLGTIYVTDALDQQVLKLSATGRLLGRWGAAGGRSQQLIAPYGIATGGRSTIYVADAAASQIDLFSSTGTSLGHWGYYGTGPGQFDGPRSVAVDPAGKIYVADTGNGRIQKLSPDGKPLAAWGSRGAGSSARFRDLASLAVDRAGDVYAADALSNLVSEFSPSGALLARWSGTGARHDRFRQPQSVAVDALGAVYVADTGNDRVVKLTR